MRGNLPIGRHRVDVPKIERNSKEQRHGVKKRYNRRTKRTKATLATLDRHPTSSKEQWREVKKRYNRHTKRIEATLATLDRRPTSWAPYFVALVLRSQIASKRVAIPSNLIEMAQRWG